MYAKVFTQIYDSSIADDWQVRVVFEDFLILGFPDGIVDMTLEAVSARTRIPIEIVSRAVKALEQPDPKSRTPDHEGRRLVLLDNHRDWGWFIVNYEKYKAIKREFDKKSYMRKFMQDKRERERKTKCLTEANRSLTSNSLSNSVPLERGVGETQIQTEFPVELPKGFPATVDDAIAHAAFVGCDLIFATDVWNKAMGRGGRDSKEVPIRSWRHHLATEWSYERARRAKDTTKTINGNSRKPFISELESQMKAKQRLAESHPANPQSIAYRKNCTDLEKASLRQLRKDISELNNQIANGGQRG